MPPSLDSPAVFDYADRQRRLAQRMEAEAADVLFLGPSADLEYCRMVGVSVHDRLQQRTRQLVRR